MEIIESGAEFDIALIAANPEPVSGLSLFNQLKDRTLPVPSIAL